MVRIHNALDSQQSFCEGNSVVRQRIQKSLCDNRNNHMPKCCHLLSSPLHHLAKWLVESSEDRIWRHHRPELVEFVDPGMLFEEGCYPFHQMPKHTKIDAMKKIEYGTHRQKDAFHIRRRVLRFQLLNHPHNVLLPVSPTHISLTHEYHLFEG